MQVLQVVHQESFLKDPDRQGWYDLAQALPFLESEGLHEHIIVNQSRDKRIPALNSEAHIYDRNNLILRNLDIRLEIHWQLKQDFNWTSHPLHVKWHFEHCRFTSSSPNQGTIFFGWQDSFRFYKNEFDFGESRGGRSWILTFLQGSSVLIQENDFRDSDLQISSSASQETPDVEEVSWEGRTAKVVKDDAYYAAMIRKHNGLPDTVRVHIPASSPRHIGLHDLSLLGNKGIDHLHLACHAANYDFRGMNSVNRLSFTELWTDTHEAIDSGFYLGSREKIDPEYQNPHYHRRLFLKLRETANKSQDSKTASNLDKLIDRIDYFLMREQKISFRADRSGWVEYCQDRILYEWRRLSSDFYTSWLRPLIWFIVGYFALNAFPFIFLDQFTWHHWLEFSLRPINRMPFYTEELQEMLKTEYQSLSHGAIVLLRLIGFIQVIWIALWGFAFGRAVKR